jgi:hypothetical protein
VSVAGATVAADGDAVGQRRQRDAGAGAQAQVEQQRGRKVSNYLRHIL